MGAVASVAGICKIGAIQTSIKEDLISTKKGGSALDSPLWKQCRLGSRDGGSMAFASYSIIALLFLKSTAKRYRLQDSHEGLSILRRIIK
jgi:hypothetical protein